MQHKELKDFTAAELGQALLGLLLILAALGAVAGLLLGDGGDEAGMGASTRPVDGATGVPPARVAAPVVVPTKQAAGAPFTEGKLANATVEEWASASAADQYETAAAWYANVRGVRELTESMDVAMATMISMCIAGLREKTPTQTARTAGAACTIHFEMERAKMKTQR